MKRLLPFMVLMLLCACGDEYPSQPDDSDAQPEILYRAADGSICATSTAGQKAVTILPGVQGMDADWAPFSVGGGRLASAHPEGGQPFSILAVDADGSNRSMLVEVTSNRDGGITPGLTEGPVISPNGGVGVFVTHYPLPGDGPAVADYVHYLYTVNTRDGQAAKRIWYGEMNMGGRNPGAIILGFSPDGKWIAFFSSTEGLCAIRPDGSDFRRIGRITSAYLLAARALAWSADGSRIAVSLHDDIGICIAVWDVGAALSAPTPIPPSAPALLFARSQEAIGDIAWSPDGTAMAVAEGSRPLRVYDMVSGTYDYVGDVDMGVRSCDWSSDGKTLLISAFHMSQRTGGELYLYDVTTRTLRMIASNVGTYSRWIR